MMRMTGAGTAENYAGARENNKIDAANGGLAYFPTYDDAGFCRVYVVLEKTLKKLDGGKIMDRFHRFCSDSYRRCRAERVADLARDLEEKIRRYSLNAEIRGIEAGTRVSKLEKNILNYVKFAGLGSSMLRKNIENNNPDKNDLMRCVTAVTNYNWFLKEMRREAEMLEGDTTALEQI